MHKPIMLWIFGSMAIYSWMWDMYDDCPDHMPQREYCSALSFCCSDIFY